MTRPRYDKTQREYFREYRKKYRATHARTDGARKGVIPEIIAWDGEGVEAPDGQPQPYVLMMNSAGGEWYAREGLGTLAIFRAMMESAHTHAKALHFIYGGSYDVNMWLRDMPEKHLREIWKQGKTIWAGYFIEYRPRKMFRVKHLDTNLSLTIWDAYPWCQSSFVKAVRDYLGADYEDLPLIIEGKARRSTFDESERDFVRKYTHAELAALVELVKRLIARLHAANIYVRRWDGPGAAAAYILRERGISKHKAETPAQVAYAAAVAYSGGRIELLQYGNYDGAVYHYDIHSAYPAAMVKLPSLAGGHWTHHLHNHPLQEHALYHVQWRSPRVHRQVPFYPFSYRAENGSIYYPPSGDTWVWGPEYLAYLQHAEYWDMEVTCVESYAFHELHKGEAPFAWVREMYDLRARWKKEGNAAEWALKLGLNSLYGKLAQTIGWSEKRRPPFYQIEWAGLITSYTRAALLLAAMTNPSACIMFATDGVFACEPLRVTESAALGDWESEIHDGITVVQSGVYFVRDGEHWRTWSRGYNVEDLSRDAVLQGWASNIASLDVSQTRFLTLGSALAGTGISPRWRSWQTAPRQLDLGPTGKRARDSTEGTPPHAGLSRSLPAFVFDGGATLASSPYNRAWKEGLRDVVNGVPLLVYEDEVLEGGI